MSDMYRYSGVGRSAEYRFTPEGVEVTSRKFGSLTRSLVPFDKIPMHSSTVTWSSKPLLWAVVVLAVFFVVATVDLCFGAHPEPLAIFLYGLFLAIVATTYLLTRVTSEVFLFEDEHLSIFRRANALGEFHSFIDSLQERRIEFLKQRVTRRFTEVSAEEIGRYLLYLREADLVDENGFTELRSHLDNLNSKRQHSGLN